MNKSEKAISMFKTMNCNQSVFAAFGPDYGISEETCFKLGLGYGGGMGRQGKTCGAVTGAYTVIGLWASQQSENKQEQKKIAAQKVAEFNTAFTDQFQYTDCKDLLGYNLSIPEEAEQINKKNLFDTVCSNIVGNAATILTRILA